MKLNIHLECFAIRKDLLTEKAKCQVLFFPEILGKNAGINKITPLKLIIIYLKTLLKIFFSFRVQVVYIEEFKSLKFRQKVSD